MDKSCRLKMLRILNGFTQESLGKLIKSPRTALSIWESGKKYGPSEESVPKLADALHVTPGYLAFGYPPIASGVWTPQVPARPHHIKAIKDDIRSLFPLFLAENNLRVAVVVELGDGGCAFLIGRADAIGPELPSNEVAFLEQEIMFLCLLLSPMHLVQVFKEALERAELEVISKQMLLDCTIDTFDVESLDRISSEGTNYSVHLELTRELSTFKDRKQQIAISSEPSTNFIFRTFMEAVKDYDVAEKDLDTLADYFALKASEIGTLPVQKIDATSLKSELKKKIESVGFRRNAGKPIKVFVESDDEDYLLIKEWLCEFWLSASDKEKAAIVDLLRENTNYTKWAERCKKELKEGKRVPLRWF